MDSKPIKFFSLLAGLLLTAYGTAVNAEINVKNNISSGNHSDKQNIATTADPSMVKPPLLHTEPTDETTTLQTVSRRVDLSGPTADSTEALEALSEEISTDDAYARVRSLLQVVEASTESVTSPTEDMAFQAEDYALDDDAHTGLDAFPSLSFPSETFSDTPLLIGDGGLPLFGDAIYWSPSRPDSHAPIGVMGDHTHEKGEFMLSYRYMYRVHPTFATECKCSVICP